LAKNRENKAVISLFNESTPYKTYHETVPERAVSKVTMRIPSKNSNHSSKVLPDINTNRDRGYDAEDFGDNSYNKMIRHFDKMDSPKPEIYFDKEIHAKNHI
jgi:hypothetical protein